jgi:nitroreductase
MSTLNLTTDELLSTTRAVRKRLDLTRPVEPEVLRECLELAIQAPTPGSSQGWHFLVVADPDQRAALAALYRKKAYAPGGQEDILKQMYERITQAGLIPVAYTTGGTQFKPATRKPLETVVHWDRW